MRAWRVHEWGEPESMRLEDVETPEPAAGQVRLRNAAAALNFFDILQVQGKYQVKPPLPFSPGFEIAGEVLLNTVSVTPRNVYRAMPRGRCFFRVTRLLGG